MWPETKINKSVKNLWPLSLPEKIDFAEVDKTITLTASSSDENRLSLYSYLIKFAIKCN